MASLREVPWPGGGQQPDVHVAVIVTEMLQEDDQLLVQVFCDLTITAQLIKKRDEGEEEQPLSKLWSVARVLQGPLHPWSIFHQFLKVFSYDERALLDLLLSSETVFLEYLLRVLKEPRYKEDDPELKIGTALRGLRDALVRAQRHGLVPYNPRALLNRFEKHFKESCEPEPESAVPMAVPAAAIGTHC